MYVLLLVALLATGGLYAAFAPGGQADASASSAANIAVAQGKKLFDTNCATCHGLNAQGTSEAPSLVGVGAAAVDFQVGTGRMPATEESAQIVKHKVRFTEAQIQQMAAYVASLGPGPQIPSAKDLDLSDADMAKGGEIFRTNCAMCHNFVGSGGALTQGKFAPSLKDVTPKHIWEAMETGPQSMPVFGDGTMTPDDKRAIIKFIKGVNAGDSPGGANLGEIGPVSEGLVGWVVGLGALIGCAVWLGAKAK
jgi:ubiquinol-cytochrome c reductase cytochrome c subunit